MLHRGYPMTGLPQFDTDDDRRQWPNKIVPASESEVGTETGLGAPVRPGPSTSSTETD